VLLGIALTVFAYFAFSVSDAITKWLVADLSVWQVLFFRSLTIVLLLLAIGRGPLLARARRSPARRDLLLRSVVLLSAWLCFYTAARDLQLAELVTLYFAAPLIVTLLAVPLLGERVTLPRWLAVTVGFVGVVVACDPGGVSFTWASALALFAAALWAFSFILIRRIARREQTLVQMLWGNGFFLIPTGFALPLVWQMPTLEQWGLMLGLSLSSCLGQFALVEGVRHAPASAVAPFEYSGLLWAFALGYLIWGDIPRHGVWLGAALILGSGLLVIFTERRRNAAPRAA